MSKDFKLHLVATKYKSYSFKRTHEHIVDKQYKFEDSLKLEATFCQKLYKNMMFAFLVNIKLYN
jgi:hypothetical protein